MPLNKSLDVMTYIALIPGFLLTLLLCGFGVYVFYKMNVRTFLKQKHASIFHETHIGVFNKLIYLAASLARGINIICGALFYLVLLFSLIFMKTGSASGIPLGLALFSWLFFFGLTEAIIYLNTSDSDASV